MGPFAGSPAHTGLGCTRRPPSPLLTPRLCTLQGPENAHRPPARPSVCTCSEQVPHRRGEPMGSRAPRPHVCTHCLRPGSLWLRRGPRGPALAACGRRVQKAGSRGGTLSLRSRLPRAWCQGHSDRRRDWVGKDTKPPSGLTPTLAGPGRPAPMPALLPEPAGLAHTQSRCPDTLHPPPPAGRAQEVGGVTKQPGLSSEEQNRPDS